ncbi:MAG: glycoside hydrolase family 43 protein [Deltaproteobacteria bacterium]|nr:glycoside hydrolase family 43 protein [Deltaproteobacteria bacterium]
MKYGKPSKPPLIKGIYTADPSAHVFDGKIYIYPSHDPDAAGVSTGDANSYNMVDYHVFSMKSIDGPVTDHGVVLQLADIPWATRQLWAPDAACRNDKCYLYFPARDQKGVFRIGVAVGDGPAGPFTAESKPIEGSYSIDPAVFIDDDGQAYMYFGGIWGGELEKWTDGKYNPSALEPSGNSPSVAPRVARLSDDMKSFVSLPREIEIIDDTKQRVKAQSGQRFFEGAWVHKYNDLYYLSYSTGDYHQIVYAIGTSPTGPFRYMGVLLTPVIGWTTHHSIVKVEGKWFLFYHDASLSGGIDHQRCVKMTPLTYRSDGAIEKINPE